MGRSAKEAVELRRSARRDRLDTELNRQVQALRTHPDVRRVVLFGSAAQRTVGEQSDLDLLVVMRSEKRFMGRLDEIYRLIQPRVATDILVYTPEEWNEMRRTSSFLRRVEAEGVVLHEAGSA